MAISTDSLMFLEGDEATTGSTKGVRHVAQMIVWANKPALSRFRRQQLYHNQSATVAAELVGHAAHMAVGTEEPEDAPGGRGGGGTSEGNCSATRFTERGTNVANVAVGADKLAFRQHSWTAAGATKVVGR